MDINMWLCFYTFKYFEHFEVKYLPLPERYDTNFYVPLSIDDLSLKNS